MKNPKKPTRKQKILISSRRLNSDNWLVLKDTAEEMRIINRKTGTKKVIHK